MAAPAEAIEREVNVRKFSGVNTQMDPVFIGGQFLRMCQNLFPNFTYRLSKRFGSPIYAKLTTGPVATITDLFYTSYQGHRFLFAYAQGTGIPGGPDYVSCFVDDGHESRLYTSGHVGLDGRFIRYGTHVYMGNGVSPLQQFDLSVVPLAPPVALVPITTLSDLGGVAQNPIPANSPASIIPGTYAFAWAVYNPTTTLYESRNDPGQSITLNAGNFLHFTAPSTGLTGGKVYRLFVSVVNQPIEFGFLQGDSVPPGATIDVTAVDVNQHFVPQKTNILATGNFFTLFLSRLVFGGDPTDPLAVKATGVILPGYESTTFNTGAFFPAFARIPMPEEVTAVGVASVTSGFDPQAPLIIFTPTRTTLYTGGDPFDPNGTASRVELSSRIGCPAHAATAVTPFGFFFLSVDSIYMIPPGGSYPQDVGWPIADQIRTIPAHRRNDAVATFHKGFVKFAFSRAGESTNATQYWLDIRTGLTSPPSWWGPMTGLPISAATVAVDHPTEWDRGWAAVDGTNTIVLTHQPGRYVDAYDPTLPFDQQGGESIMSVFRTGTFDDDHPFMEKIFTRFRCIAHAEDRTSLAVTVITDSGRTWKIDPIVVLASAAAQWNHLTNQGLAIWNHLLDETADGGAEWTAFQLVEAQTISPLVRPRGLSCEVIVSHVDDGDIQFRDFELLYLPVDRKVRAGNPPTGS